MHEATSTILLNAVDLELAFPVVNDASGSETMGTVELDEHLERALLRFPTELQPGPHTLAIRFDGVLNDELRGFYRSTFTDDAGTTHTIATTQFEATDARRAFPCFDEPALKATFYGDTRRTCGPRGLLERADRRRAAARRRAP